MVTVELLWALLLAAAPADGPMNVRPDAANEIAFPPAQARFVRLLIHRTVSGQPCIDELEVFAPQGKENLALASAGAKATASSCLPGHAIHQVPHLNDGRYGNGNSWIAAGPAEEWAEVELPVEQTIDRVVFSRDRQGQYKDRLAIDFEVLVSLDGEKWQSARAVKAVAVGVPAPPKPAPPSPQSVGPLDTSDATLASLLAADELVAYAFLCEARTCSRIDPTGPIERVLGQLEEMIDRLASQGIDTSGERQEAAELRQRLEGWLAAGQSADPGPTRELFVDARQAKRKLMFRDPALQPLESILFVHRHPYLPSHNYSVILDAQGPGGGAVCRLEIPWLDGRLAPEHKQLVRLFDAGQGVPRDPAASFDADKIYFAHQAAKGDYFRLMVMNADGSDVRQLTDGPFHDYFPCPLGDGGLAFISTRCRARFLCWRPQAFVLFRMDADGKNILPLSHSNLSEWTPSLMRDGRILWMRSEYLDKGADFGHTLCAIRPDGGHPELIFGNNTINCYANGQQVPGTSEYCCTLVAHGGDLNGPIALLEPSKGRSNPEAIHILTPDSPFYTHMTWARRECFRDPVPISRDYVLCSHAPDDRFGLYVIDRYGNRELLHMDPAIGAMSPTMWRPVAPPPALPPAPQEPSEMGSFVVADVYQGLGPEVERGRVKYLRVCQEVRADLLPLPDGGYQADHEPFQDWYATPIHKVSGPNGWPSYVAKGDLGLAQVEEDGSAHFLAPAGKVLYFQALDGDFNEIQRMRSVVQLQPGETRSCVGCHENRLTAPPVRQATALRRQAEPLEPPPWGAGPFAYERVVQPVWDNQCTRCHNAKEPNGLNLTAACDAEGVPASFRSLIEGGWVHYFNFQYGQEHQMADPLTFGTLKSRLWEVLDGGHYDVRLTLEEKHRIKCWIDLNCPLWPDYQFRPDRLPQTVSR
ncbi:MAG: HzsA-related protein [Thermoguttaceae bacterium]